MSGGCQSYGWLIRHLLQRLHKVGGSVCIGSTFFLRLLFLGLDLSTLVANEFQYVIVVEDFGTGIENLDRVSLCVLGRLR
jgi:hypothetical protein